MSNKKGSNNKTKPNRVKPLSPKEGLYAQQLVEANNQYTQTLKQLEMYKFAVKKMNEDRKKVQKGELKGPFQLTVIPKILSRIVEDKKEILELFDEQLKTYNNMIKSLTGQVEHRYEEFVESAVRNREFLITRFGDQKVKSISADRRTAKNEEETIFEAEFEKLVTDPELKKEFDEKRNEAAKANLARKTKK